MRSAEIVRNQLACGFLVLPVPLRIRALGSVKAFGVQRRHSLCWDPRRADTLYLFVNGRRLTYAVPRARVEALVHNTFL